MNEVQIREKDPRWCLYNGGMDRSSESSTFYVSFTDKSFDNFQRDERVLVVWSDSIDTIVPTCYDFEDRLIKLLWRSRGATSHATSLSSRPASVNGEWLLSNIHASAPPSFGTVPGYMRPLMGRRRLRLPVRSTYPHWPGASSAQSRFSRPALPPLPVTLCSSSWPLPFLVWHRGEPSGYLAPLCPPSTLFPITHADSMSRCRPQNQYQATPPNI